MRWLGLDIGDKTIGVAVSDPLFISAQGVTTIERVGDRKDTTKIVDLVKEYDCSLIVCGLPLMLSGEDSPQTAKVRAFVTLLENKLRSSGLSKVEVVLYDERYTTKMAEDVLMIRSSERGRGMDRRQRKEHVDRLAAQLILQSYMDMQANQGLLPKGEGL
ncbi:MAG: Holliday junction resolvase RuvX [Firmicutes bacterium]|nr:Holliday junction resolvase RuvX [Bacillota bacterium]MBQ4233307.1 Holliday junction resolvase RuvX [Bacillota bacterium]MBQ6260693.1 Holliday junction resolvase RuvX [Bacillota bacterium]MBR0114212.1 Holliday junction resolvase RuvX [Bacillota bacterium]MBR0441547.1 Holliday junction resolvase RuvX [Bacillota bacterium]